MIVAASVLGFLLMVAGLLGLIYTHALLSPNPVVIAIQAAAVVVMAAARLTFGRRSFHPGADPTEGGLVTSGPYRYVRHPIYTSIVLFALAGALAHISFISLLCLGVVVTGAVVRMLSEETLLRRKYPDYSGYAARTKRMIPGVF